jgi:hypothetical protein
MEMVPVFYPQAARIIADKNKICANREICGFKKTAVRKIYHPADSRKKVDGRRIQW